MNIPKIKTPEGFKPITILPDVNIVTAFFDSSAPSEDKEIVRFLDHLHNPVAAGSVLRYVLENGRDLVPVYPGLGQTIPKGAQEICSIIDGVLIMI